MRKTSLLYKTLVVGVIVLFIGIVIQPAIAIVEPKNIDIEYFEITTELCGLNGRNFTVQLTKEEAENVKELFESIQANINMSKTRKETEIIFREAIVELDKYGLLGNMSIEQVQKLIFNQYHNFKFKEYKNQENSQEIENFFCLLVGYTSRHVDIQGPFARFGYLLSLAVFNLWGSSNLCKLFNLIYKYLEEHEYYNLIGIFYLITLPIAIFLMPFFWTIYLSTLSCIFYFSFPLNIGTTIGFGYEWKRSFSGESKLFSVQGWIHTYGINGYKNWTEQNGEFYGRIPTIPIRREMITSAGYFYPGAIGFTGIHIRYSPDEWAPMEDFFIGSSLWLKIGSEPPED